MLYVINGINIYKGVNFFFVIFLGVIGLYIKKGVIFFFIKKDIEFVF